MFRCPATVNLYKRIIHAGRDYPGGLSVVREKAKKQFLSNRNETDPEKLQQLLSRGEYVLGEIHELNSFHKYRQMKKRYYDRDSEI